jgi:hypothetical protein
LADGEDGICVDTLNSNHYYFPTQIFNSDAAKVVNNMNEDCYNLFQLHALGFGGVRDASSFKLPDIPGKVFAYSVSTNSLKDVMLSITKKNLNNCIPREENEICCKKGTKWDDEEKKCK